MGISSNGQHNQRRYYTIKPARLQTGKAHTPEGQKTHLQNVQILSLTFVECAKKAKSGTDRG